MKSLVVIFALLIDVTCKTICGEEGDSIPTKPEDCHWHEVAPDNYCCYFEGKNLNTNQDEKLCMKY